MARGSSALPAARRLGPISSFCLTLALVTTATGMPSSRPATATKGAPRPNVLVIISDDQRGDTVEGMPAVQRWFAEFGTYYPNAYVTTPLCCPSRATIMTGRYTHNHGVTNNQNEENLAQWSTLQAILHRHGYRTGIAGKYFNGWNVRRRPPFFDRWSIFRGGYHDRPFNIDGEVRPVRRYTTDFVRRQAELLLRGFEREDHRPWLLYVTPAAPHRPYTPASRHANAPVPPWNPPPSVTEVDRTDKPPGVQQQHETPEMGEENRAGQIRSLMAIDELVARLMQTLGSLNERERTLAFYLSDNGHQWSEHALTDKRYPYTESILVPLLMRWPGHIAAGVVDTRAASNVDLAPTVLQAAGVAQTEFDGRSLLTSWSRPRRFIEHFPDRNSPEIPAWASIRTDYVQYAEYYGADGVTIAFREYYDLVADPYQLENLLGDASPANDPPPGELALLSAEIANGRSCRGTSGPSACP